MKFVFLILTLVCASIALQAQIKKNQIGLRIGDPLGVSYKRLFSEKNAMEVIVGTGGGHPNYYERSFTKEYFPDIPDLQYEYHDTKDVVYLQLRYIRHMPIVWTDVPGKWEWYWGAGVMAKRADILYGFRVYYTVEGKRYYTIEEATVGDYDIGPELLIGMQYSFNKIPMTIGFDFGAMLELYDFSPVLKGYAGLAFRYNF